VAEPERQGNRGAGKFRVVLIKPSQYDDDGFVVRHLVGTVPSNTLSTIHGLVHEFAVERNILGEHVETTVELYDETVRRIPVTGIIRRARKPDTRAVVWLCGVQTPQYPRAFDIARRFREAGIDVMIGGFHVSGSLAMLPIVSEEIQQIMDMGVTVAKGEIEGRFEELLLAAYRGKLRPLYDYSDDLPDLVDVPMPRFSKSYFGRFPYDGLATIDAGRGCPFRCSFCTIINVQGRKMRARSPENIAESMVHHYEEHGISDYLITDDNFARNENWEGILDAMIELREHRGIPIRYMMETDTAAHRIPRFVQKSARAGCFQNFVGMESINEASLAAARKTQNKPDHFAEMIEIWRERGVVTQVGYIIGFPDDTYESVMRDVHTLKTEIKPELASFFMLTPLPGSADHLRLWSSGAPMDADLNRYDSTHAVVAHPKMSGEEWVRAYRDAWKSFYEYDNVRAVLSRVRPQAYKSCFGALVWYRQATLIQHAHPLVAGFWRKRDRRSRRPGFEREGLLESWVRRGRDNLSAARRGLPLLAETYRLWRETHRSDDTRGFPRPVPASRSARAQQPLFQRGRSSAL
jgi:radical SAM superfamily enzyme YgiQ (UPF0313 family)